MEDGCSVFFCIFLTVLSFNLSKWHVCHLILSTLVCFFLSDFTAIDSSFIVCLPICSSKVCPPHLPPPPSSELSYTQVLNPYLCVCGGGMYVCLCVCGLFRVWYLGSKLKASMPMFYHCPTLSTRYCNFSHMQL